MTEQLDAPYFSELKDLARYTRKPELHEEGRERLIRFLDSYTGALAVDPVVDSLCIHFGLYPYLSPSKLALSTAEALAVEFHRPNVDLRGDDFFFHSDQSKIFYQLMDGKSIILSAPTSFGKSVILDALVASGMWRNIVVIVPTIALIDEVRRRLVRIANQYNLVTHPSQKPAERNIYVLTQERFLELPDLPEVGLFMIDEFYKLGSSNPDDQRMSMLNIAWSRLRSTGAQYYLTGPNVDSLATTLDSDLRGSLLVSDYKTVAVDIEDRSFIPDEDRLADMAEYWPALEGSTLTFVSAPPRAERVAVAISQFQPALATDNFATQVADWLAENFHPSWRVVEALKGGVGTHTGPMPRSLQRIMIRLFGSGKISSLVCTTTLIEGVNTTARNVIVYDKKIDRRPIDYFTFSNVRGRAGRMSSHFVGNVISYMEPPNVEKMEVDIPIDSQSESAPLSSIVQLPKESLNSDSRGRLDNVMTQSDLSLDTIKANRGYDPEIQVEAARLLRANKGLRSNFAWTGYPTNEQARSVLEFGLLNLLAPRQRRGMNVNRMWGMLGAVRDTQGDLLELVARQSEYRFPNEDRSDVVSTVLAFQRNWMGFTIPSLLRACQRIYNEVATSANEQRSNYEYYLSQIESLFLAPSLLDLDEYGLPLPLALRFSQLGMVQAAEVSEVLDSFVRLAQQQSVRSSLSAVELWIVDDVLAGLGMNTSSAQDAD
ncbi:DEAD/DEAH box helicase [Brevibacterium sp. CFH 10365]|uniref:DEAD/DEAH box helicase n=1 Tax=Brevibacterium sp. CFH 10365 TaxID=2585207 RepID=UPI001266410A|nr:DEAD/DEAH box helicase [Brevibacterium sp. CFH 10365]